MTVGIELLPLKREDIEVASMVLVRAFFNDPLTVSWFPDPRQRLRLCRDILAVELHYGLLAGEAYVTSPRIEGVGIWMPPRERDVSFWAMLRAGFFSLLPRIGYRTLRRIQACERHAMDLRKKHADCPHWYLTLIGVDPHCQGRGWGTRLLSPILKQIDAAGMTCYLETHNFGNVRFYSRFGFEVVTTSIVPETEVVQYSMLRKVTLDKDRMPELKDHDRP